MSLGQKPVIVALAPQEVLRLEVLLADKNPDEAWTFLRELYEKVRDQTIRGTRSHLDK